MAENAAPASSRRPAIRKRVFEGDAARRGTAHGRAHAQEIRRYTDERVRLVADGSWLGEAMDREAVLGLAESMVPAHRAYAPDLCEEMEAMAAGSGLTPAEAVIVGGFTDFVDVVRGRVGSAPEEDDCTAVLVPHALADGRGFLAQTWDMHDSATQYVVMLEILPERGPRALCFSTVGCLGQIGMNEAGIAIGINNLAAAVGRIGVTWPFVILKVLQQTNLEDALACLTDVELAGAHNYQLLDREGRGYNVEAMPDCLKVDALDGAPLVHTNHCLHDETRRSEAPRASVLLESSHARLQRAEELLAGSTSISPEQLMELTRDPEAICQRARPPFHIESSGAVVMRPASGDLWAVWGLPSENEYVHFEIGG